MWSVETERVCGQVKTYLLLQAHNLVFVTVIILPFLFGIYLTFTNWDGISKAYTFVSFSNYKQVFQDPAFWTSFLRTVKYVFWTVLIVNGLGFFLAYALTGNTVKGQNLLRTGFFVPNLIGGIILGLVWRFIFSNVLVFIGRTLNVGFLSYSWLANPNKALWLVIRGQIGCMMIICAGLHYSKVLRPLLTASGFTPQDHLLPSGYLSLPVLTIRGALVYDMAFPHQWESRAPSRSACVL